MQPVSSVAKWDGDKLTFWGMGQGIYPQRAEIARALKIDPANIRYINKWNGCTFGSVMAASRMQPFIAYIARVAGRPVKIMLTEDQEFAYIAIKPETITKFKVGAKKDGRIVALLHEVHLSAGAQDASGHATTEVSKNNTELYTSNVPHWKSVRSCYKTNAMNTNPVRSYTQQEIKWAWENMIDEMAEAVGMDPLPFRLLHISKPDTKLLQRAATTLNADAAKLEIRDGAIFSTEDPKKRTTFAALAKANGGVLRQTSKGLPRGPCQQYLVCRQNHYQPRSRRVQRRR